MALTLSIVVFAATFGLIVWRPKQLNEAYFALPGALILLGAGALAWEDAEYIWQVVWNATLSLIGIMVLTALMDGNGFFRWAALHIARRFHRRRMALLVGLAGLSGLITTFFNNDGTVLIMTPIVLELTALLGMGTKARIAFLLAVGFMADTASATLMVSNLTNILTADFFGMTFGDYASHMAFPGLAAAVATVFALAALFGRTIRQDSKADSASEPSFPEPSSAIRHKGAFRLSWALLAIILIAYFASEKTGFPVSFVACAGAAVLWIASVAMRSADSASVVRRTPWLIVVFALSMNLIVYSMHLHGATTWFPDLLEPAAQSGLAGSIFASGALFSLLAAFMNNLPAVLVSSLSISQIDGGQILPFASLIGMSVGAKLTPLGSLATLLWLSLVRRDGIRLGWVAYMKYGFLLTLPVLAVALGALWLQTRFG